MSRGVFVCIVVVVVVVFHKTTWRLLIWTFSTFSSFGPLNFHFMNVIIRCIDFF